MSILLDRPEAIRVVTAAMAESAAAIVSDGPPSLPVSDTKEQVH